MKYTLFSLFFHILIVVFALETTKNKLEFKQIGKPKVSFTMIGNSKKIDDLSQNIKVKEVKPLKERSIEKKQIKKVKVVKDIRKEKIIKKIKAVKDIKKEKIKKQIKETPKEKVSSKLEATGKKYDVISLESKIKEGEKTLEKISSKEETNTGFIKLKDGSIIAKNQGVKGLSYGFLSQPEPNYPEIAKKMGFNKDVTIKVRFLIGYDGHIEEIKFYDDIEKFGFRNEVKKALNEWKSTPITINGNKVKLYFYKKFKFEKK